MKKVNFYEPLNAKDVKYKELKITIDYSLGGLDYFNGGSSKRGIYAYLSPIDRNGGFESMTMLGNQRESGYKVFLEELKRGSQKKIDEWALKIGPYTDRIVKFYEEGNNDEIIKLLK